jgi:hypothetical protein
MPARFRPLAELNAISSLHRRQHRATITVPPLKRGAEAKVPLLYRSRERVPAAPSQVDVELANTIVRAGVAEGGTPCYATPDDSAGLLDRAGDGRLPVQLSWGILARHNVIRTGACQEGAWDRRSRTIGRSRRRMGLSAHADQFTPSITSTGEAAFGIRLPFIVCLKLE